MVTTGKKQQGDATSVVATSITLHSDRRVSPSINGLSNRMIDGSARLAPSRISSLRSMTIPRFALRRSEAAASFGISEGTFDKWVREGKMPRGRHIEGVVLWDTKQLGAAWDELVDEPARSNPFDRIIV